MPSSSKFKPYAFSRRRFLQGIGAGATGVVVAPESAKAQIQIDKERPGRGTVPVQLRVNGEVYHVKVEPRFTLLDVLRNQLDITGGKRVCDRGECGACTVLLDGRPVYACSRLAIDAEGGEIQTIEGLSAGGELHPLQEAFIKNDALQCGFCTPGMVMALRGLLDHNTDPTLDEVKEAVSGNLCKCGTYIKIFRAVRDAAEMMRKRS